MPVPSTVADLSTTAGSNSPAGSDTVTDAAGPDDYLRAHAAIIKTLDNRVTTHEGAADPHPGYLTETAATAGYQPLDADLTAIAGLTSAANKVPRFTGSGTAEVIDVAYGTYTPTFTTVAGITTAAALGEWRYTRIGTNVIVSGGLTLDASAVSTIMSFRATLPVASDFTSNGDAAGSLNASDAANNGTCGLVNADTTNDALAFSALSGSAGHTAQSWYFIAQYVIK